MRVVVDIQSGSSFSIDVDFWDTVLTIKQKIEKSQGIPVFKQTLFLQGKVIQDHLDYFECQFLHNSRLLLSISPDDNTNQNNNDQVPHQTQEPPSAPTNPIHDEFVNNQDLPVMSNNDQVPKSEESPVTLELRKEFFGIQDLPPVTVGSRRNRNQVVQTEQSSPSDSHKEIIRISDSPVKKKIKTSPMNMTVMVQPFEETRRIPLEVNARDNVEEMRKELVKMQQRGELNLPHEGYFFIHKQAVLDEDQSFWWNGVAHGDTIEIFRGYVTNDQSQLHNQRWRPNINRA